MEPTPDELKLLRSLPREDDDGWPLCILAHGGDLDSQRTAALGALRKGLIAVFGRRPDDSTDLRLDEAEAVLADPNNWDGVNDWMVYLTAHGNGVLAARD